MDSLPDSPENPRDAPQSRPQGRLFVAFRGLWAIYIHANVRLPTGPLRLLIGAPELHHWHHDRDRDAGNYANLSPLMDLLFGTYRCPDREPAAFGLKHPGPRTYLGLLVRPLWSARRTRTGATGTMTSDLSNGSVGDSPPSDLLEYRLQAVGAGDSHGPARAG